MTDSQSYPVTEEAINSGFFHDGIDEALTLLCKFLGVDPGSINWDAASETVEGDVSAVIGNIFSAKFGEDWGPKDAGWMNFQHARELAEHGYTLRGVQSLESTKAQLVEALSRGGAQRRPERDEMAKAIQQFWQGPSGRPWDGSEDSCCVKLPPQADWFRRLADVVLSVAPAQEAWQPIETAPKDECVMLCVADFEPTAGRWWPVDSCWVAFNWEGHFETDKEMTDYLNGSRYEPTHWMPLPAGPSVSSTEGK